MRCPSLHVLALFALLAACGDDSPKATASVDAGGEELPHADATTAADHDAAVMTNGDATTRPPVAASDAALGDAGTSAANVRLPPANGGLDYQLGGAYTPPTGVTILSRDRHEQPAVGLYNVCYINGFQAQTEEADFWTQQQPDLVLRDSAGKPVIDTDWNEMLLDVSTDDKRTRLATIVGGWIGGCADAGFDAVEIDNLDSYSRSKNLLTMDDAVLFVAKLADIAHARGLAIAQKNASELVPRKTELRTDFVVSEECSRYDECGDYIAGYGDHVLMIEYRRADFTSGCSKYPSYSIVLRDLDLVVPGDKAYVFDDC